MSKILTYLREMLAYEPAVAAWAADGGVAALAGFVFHVSSTQEAAITTICTALAALYTAVRARPVAVPALTGAVATIATAAAAFGLHLPAGVISTGVTVLSAVLALILRQNLTPAVALKPAQKKAAPQPAAM